jgi:DNA-binding MarR family transcriptional regulator
MVYEPARLAIVTGLAAFESTDFLSLQKLTGLTPGNLSVHLTKLEQAGLVAIEKPFAGRKPRTTVRLTRHGHGGWRAIGGAWTACASRPAAGAPTDPLSPREG